MKNRYEITTNMRATLYSYLMNENHEFENERLDDFCSKYHLEKERIKDFMYGKLSYLSENDFKKLSNILNPPKEINQKWKHMYLIISS